MATAKPISSAPASYGFNWKNAVIPALNIVSIASITYRIAKGTEQMTLFLGVDIAAHVLALVTTKASHDLMKIANVGANALRALEFLSGVQPLGTAFGLFAAGIHVVNTVKGVSLFYRLSTR